MIRIDLILVAWSVLGILIGSFWSDGGFKTPESWISKLLFCSLVGPLVWTVALMFWCVDKHVDRQERQRRRAEMQFYEDKVADHAGRESNA